MSKTKEQKQTKTKKSKAGRPAGGGASYDVNQVPDQPAKLTKCKRRDPLTGELCGSTKRAPYWGITRQVFGGQVIVRKRTRCLAPGCGQCRIDRHYEPLPESE